MTVIEPSFGEFPTEDIFSQIQLLPAIPVTCNKRKKVFFSAYRQGEAQYA